MSSSLLSGIAMSSGVKARSFQPTSHPQMFSLPLLLTMLSSAVLTFDVCKQNLSKRAFLCDRMLRLYDVLNNYSIVIILPSLCLIVPFKILETKTQEDILVHLIKKGMYTKGL